VRNLRAGQFASSNPRSILLAGALAYRASVPDGLQVGIFGFADPDTGFVDNARTSLRSRCALVLPIVQYRALPHHADIIPPGYEVTLATAGDFLVAFPGGAIAGQRVYASILDGSPVSGETPGTEITNWVAMHNAAPGELCVISSWSHMQ
jgi:hypothetical protein